MFAKTEKNGLTLRPHFKTHQSLQVGRWFKEAGVNKITVSSLTMAKYFSTEWSDITVAFPVNILEMATINELAKKITLNLLVESEEAVLFLQQNLSDKVGVFIKIDVGTKRTGVASSDIQKIENILTILDSSSMTKFLGFLGHAGHTYQCRNQQDVLRIHDASRGYMRALKVRFKHQYPNLTISLGDTPSCSIAEEFDGIDEIRPGNFVFYDLMQQQIGANSIDEIAVTLACPIVAIHKDRNELVVYGGGVHLSKERLNDPIHGIIYGKVAVVTQGTWGQLKERTYVKSLSQEHGIISVPEGDIHQYQIGDQVLIFPVHSCMTANLMKFYLSDDQTIDMMPT